MSLLRAWSPYIVLVVLLIGTVFYLGLVLLGLSTLRGQRWRPTATG
jgi:hypothetical protein